MPFYGDAGDPGPVLEEREMFRQRAAGLTAVEGQRSQDLTCRRHDRHRPAVSQSCTLSLINDRCPLRVLGDVLGYCQPARPCGRTARADVWPDYDAVDPGQVLGGREGPIPEWSVLDDVSSMSTDGLNVGS